MQATKRVTKPTKQRKLLYQAPDHIRYKHFGAALSSKLKVTHGVNALPVRSGDTVKIMRGDHKGFEGKITRVDRQEYRIFVEGLTSEKVDGTAFFVPIHPSKVMITNLNLEDKWRKAILERKRARPEKAKTVEKKPPKAPSKIVEEVKEEVVEEKPALEEAPKEKKPKAKRKKTAKVATEKPAKKATETKEGKPKAKKPRAKRKTTKKTEKTEGGA